MGVAEPALVAGAAYSTPGAVPPPRSSRDMSLLLGSQDESVNCGVTSSQPRTGTGLLSSRGVTLSQPRTGSYTAPIILQPKPLSHKALGSSLDPDSNFASPLFITAYDPVLLPVKSMAKCSLFSVGAEKGSLRISLHLMEKL
ncbi:hypothetical protein UY3_14885 [Chelonia mydas]|uniref:Uncharacterized protein n=1 Tax=Chelonia mydas TaxID=8469 RepID=M7ATL4_CHEMY|nr:hypothetical protein UY3_14885 [Chelonia mydas]